MLSEEEKQEIQGVIGLYREKKGASVEALKIVQRHRGWISDDSLKEVSSLLDMTADELDGIATFYNLVYREPVGRHVILVCASVSCWIMGYESLLKHLESRLAIGLGQTTPDSRFTLLPMACMGACDHAPVMMVDEDLYVDLTPERIDQILEQYL